MAKAKSGGSKAIVFLLIIVIMLTCGLLYAFHVKGKLTLPFLKDIGGKEITDKELDAMELATDDVVNNPLKMAELIISKKGENNDLIGWIVLPGTNVNSPVMFVPEDRNKPMTLPEIERYTYIKRSFYGGFDHDGVPFLSDTTPVTDNNLPNSNLLLIYGHDGINTHKAFHDLIFYKDQNYWSNNKLITYYDAAGNRHMYEVFAVFNSRVYKNTDDVFKYYQYNNLESAEAFNSYVQNVRNISMYDTGIVPQYGEKLMALSLCDLNYYPPGVENHNNKDSRYVVVGREIN